MHAVRHVRCVIANVFDRMQRGAVGTRCLSLASQPGRR